MIQHRTIQALSHMHQLEYRVRTLRFARGVGMVEVLVALVVLSVGMLGTATLYVTSLQAKTTAISRMQAINLATDMADRIRANRSVLASPAYAIAQAAVAPTPLACIQTISTAAVTCTPDQMAAADLFMWSNAVTTTLPGTVTRSITVTAATATSPAIYVIALGWSEPSVGALTHTLQVEI